MRNDVLETKVATREVVAHHGHKTQKHPNALDPAKTKGHSGIRDGEVQTRGFRARHERFSTLESFFAGPTVVKLDRKWKE